MNYVIKNHKNLYIRLSENGKTITCSENDKGLFEYSKAKNILDSIPKTLKKLKFEVEAVPEIAPRNEKEIIKKEITKREEYVPSENITCWIEKFGTCADILDEARQTEERLALELELLDKELIDITYYWDRKDKRLI